MPGAGAPCGVLYVTAATREFIKQSHWLDTCDCLQYAILVVKLESHWLIESCDCLQYAQYSSDA